MKTLEDVPYGGIMLDLSHFETDVTTGNGSTTQDNIDGICRSEMLSRAMNVRRNIASSFMSFQSQ